MDNSRAAPRAARPRVVATTSRTVGEVGVVVDSHGLAAGVELDLRAGAALDVAAVARFVAADAARPTAVQVRRTADAPSVGAARHCRVHVLLRVEPARCAAPGAALPSLVAAVDRLAAHLRRAAVANHVVDVAGLSALVAGDLDPCARLHPAAVRSGADVERLVSLVDAAGCARSVISLRVDVSGFDVSGFDVSRFDVSRGGGALAAAVLVGAPLLGAAGAPAVDPMIGAAVDDPFALAAVLPLGGGPADPRAALVRSVCRPRRPSRGPLSARRRRWSTDAPLTWPFAPVGVVLGRRADRSVTAVPLLVPDRSTRIGVLGDVGLARLLALRLLGQGCDLTVVTDRPATWAPFTEALPGVPVAVVEQVRRWPFDGTPAPWALLIDMPQPPPPRFTRAPWSTVVHLTPGVPADSSWWRGVDLLLSGRAHARELAPGHVVEAMDAEQVLVVHRPGGGGAAMPGAGQGAGGAGRASVVRPDLDEHEYRVLAATAGR